MEKSNFIPKSDINDYLKSHLNLKIYLELSGDNDWNGIFDPLEFFNLLYEQYEIIKCNKHLPAQIIIHLNRLEISKFQLYFLLDYLDKVIFEKGIDSQFFIIQKLIENEFNKLGNELYPKDAPSSSIFINNFDNVESSKVYNHFMNGLVIKGHLSEIELNAYLKLAFESVTIPKTLFDLKNTTNSKMRIYALFYSYYVNLAGKPHGNQHKYVALLGNYFKGYKNELITSNWSKAYERFKSK